MAFSAVFIYQITDKYSAKIRAMKRVTDELRRKIAVTGAGMVKLGGTVGKLSTRLANLRTGFLAMTSARGLQAVIKESAKFEHSLNRVAAFSQASSEEMLSLAKTARKLGIETKFSATEVADAMAVLSKKGFDTSKILGTLPTILTMATAGDIELARASDIVTGSMFAFSLGTEKAAHIADVYAITATRTATDMEQLNAAMINAAPLAAAAGVKFEELSALIGIMANKNIRGSISGTLLMNSFRNLVAPTKDAIKTMQKFGFKKAEITDSSGQLVDFIKVLELFDERGVGIQEFFRIFQIRGAKAVAALQGQNKPLRELLSLYIENTGAAENMAAIIQSGIIKSLTESKSAWEGLKEAIGKGLEPITKGVLAAFTAMSRFVAKHPKFAKTLGIVLAVLTVILSVITIVGVVLAAIAGFITVVGIISGAAIATGAAIIAIIAGVVAIAIMLWKIIKDLIEIGKLLFTIWLNGTKKWLNRFKLLGQAIKEKILAPLKHISNLWGEVQEFFGKDTKHELSSTMIAPDNLNSSNTVTVVSVIKGNIDVNDRTRGNVGVSSRGGAIPLNVNTDAGYSMAG